jgi:hypothetical protein
MLAAGCFDEFGLLIAAEVLKRSPKSSNVRGSRPRTWSRTARLTLIPPGSANASIREAMATPSP